MSRFIAPSTLDVEQYVRGNTPLARALDVSDASLRTATVALLGQGEHNVNYTLTLGAPDLRTYVLRINIESQLNLPHQIAYEFESLRALQQSGRTPQALFLDDSRGCKGHHLLIEEYLDGRWMDFARQSDISEALCTLADIHALAPNSTHQSESRYPLIRPANPLQAQLEECQGLVKAYRCSALCDENMLRRLQQLLQQCERLVQKGRPAAIDSNHIINTEAVPSHFLINEQGYGHMVDWEKPLLGEAAQDLAYFLSPTTTIWDTDFIFSAEQRRQAIRTYCASVDNRFDVGPTLERLAAYTATNCLRGLAWSARAWTQYQDPNNQVQNEKTRDKLSIYLDEEFFDLCWQLVLDNS